MLLVFTFLVAVLSFLVTGMIVMALRKQDILDQPNERSNHVLPTPRGAGLGFVAIISIAWWVLGWQHNPQIVWVIGAIALLAFVSFIDDLHSLSASIRFMVQIIAVGLGLYSVQGVPIFQNMIPLWLEYAVLALAWLWYINLTNFMDGIDGITAVETFSIALGVALITALLWMPEPLTDYAMVMAAAMVGFIWWNWHPAKCFMGDAGSIPLGFMLAYILTLLAQHGCWAASLILPGYYLIDSGITLAKRILMRERFWEAHSQHFYQRAVRMGHSHTAVVITIAVTNICLIAIAVNVSLHPAYWLLGLLGAMTMSLGCCWWLVTGERVTDSKEVTRDML